MKGLILPLIDYLLSHYPELSFTNVRIIGVQHILETTHAMFKPLYAKGLNPKNISLLGKCYSTNQEVLNEMQQDGIDVTNKSLEYDSHTAFDQLFEREIACFIEQRKTELQNHVYDLIIVLDDGGKFLKYIKNTNLCVKSSIIGIEQTSSGYEQIKDQKHSFPIINVAKNPLKLNIESPMIAKAFCERLFNSLKRKSQEASRFLIIGGGAIGKCIFNEINKENCLVDILDINPKLSLLKNCKLANIINMYDCIIGCTGSTSINKSFHNLIKSKIVFASASSSDREFDSVFLRRKTVKNRDCHKDEWINNILLLNSGFPVNFDGERENIDPSLIQLTIALILAGMCQAVLEGKKLKNDIISISKKSIKLIELGFSMLHPNVYSLEKRKFA